MSVSKVESIEKRIEVLDGLVAGSVLTDDIFTSLTTRDGLLDALLVLYEECSHDYLLKKNKHVSTFIRKYSSTIAEVKKLRISMEDFEVKDVIGRGHFGEVQVVREKSTGTVHALKTLHKHETLAQHEISFFEEERDIMALSNSPWITKLHYAFQDSLNLYLVMEFHAGGDLLSLLSRYDDIFEERMAKFYIAEMTLAIQALHCMGYVHRDIKPENILIDIQGHIKLVDFGSAAKLSPDMLVSFRMPVGTPDYVSPELLTSINNKQIVSNYGVEVDWWSLGVCMYEMLYGKTPFTDENGSLINTYSRIMNFKKCLSFPDSPTVSESAISLIKGLLADKSSRIMYEGIVAHPFLSDLDMENMKQVKPPFVPHLSSLDDTSNFEEFEKKRYQPSFDDYNTSKEFSGKDLPFVGFTYVRPLNSVEDKDSESLPESDTSTEESVDCHSVEVKLTVKVNELQSKNHDLEESQCSIRSEVERLQMKTQEKDEELRRMEAERDSMERELQDALTQKQFLAAQLDKASAEKEQLELHAMKNFNDIFEMRKEAQAIEEEILRCQVEELQEVATELEREKESLLRKVSQRDKQIESYREQITANQKQQAELQSRLAKARRKSLGDQKRDLALLESQSNTWREQISEKTDEIREKDQRIQELEDMLEAYEQQEKDFMEREQVLLDKLQTTPSKEKVDIKVMLTTSKSPGKKEINSKIKKIQELEDLLEKYEADSKAWQEEEDQYNEIIETLSGEVAAMKHQSRLTVQAKENLLEQIRLHQEEIGKQKQKIKGLQEHVNTYIEGKRKDSRESSLEKHVKELEIEVEMLRDDKRMLMKDKLAVQTELDSHKCTQMDSERKINRLTAKLERTERQLSASRDREIQVRIKSREAQEIREKLQEENLKAERKENDELKAKLSALNVELEQLKHTSERDNEVKDLRNTLETSNQKIVQLQQKVDKLTSEKFDFLKEIREVKEEKDRLEEMLKLNKKELEKVEKNVSESTVMKEENSKLKNEKDQLKSRLSDLESEKLMLEVKLTRECEAVNVKLQSVEQELEEQKILSAKRWNKIEDAEDLRQENKLLQSKVEMQKKKADELELKIKDLEGQMADSKKKLEKMSTISQELDKLKLVRRSSEVKIQELQRELADNQQRATSNKKDVQHLEEKLHKEKEQTTDNMSELKKELQESNLALSEARSLVSAMQRQEQSLRDKFNQEIRELQMKLHKSQGSLHLEHDINSVIMEKQNLQLKQKEMEERIGNLLKEKGTTVLEKQNMEEKVVQSQQQCELERKKAEVLRGVVTDLEDQLKDYETLIEEYEKQQADWEDIKKKFESAVDERELEIEGTSQKIQELQHAKQNASEKLNQTKKESQAERASLKSEIEALKMKEWESRKEIDTWRTQVKELENNVSKCQAMLKSQVKNMDADSEEKNRLKEEISSKITEIQDLRSKNLKLKQSLGEAMDKFEMIFGEKVDLENFAEALQGLHFLEKYKFESMIGQQMKLIDYLHALYEENNSKKKKTAKKGRKSFNFGKVHFPAMEDLQNSLELERKRNVKLTEQMDKMRQENYSQAQELLQLKGPLKEKVDTTLTPHEKAAVACRTPLKSVPSAILTPRAQRYNMDTQEIHPLRMHHNIPHRFVTGLNTRATKCGVCLGSVPFVKKASKCQACLMTCHTRCTSAAPSTCGLPTDYIHYFTTIMSKIERTSKKFTLEDTNQIKIKGWLKVPRTGKPGWEKRWCSLENNILLMYREESDANPIDTFDLNPAETDVTVHSAISSAELPNTASTDLPYVLKLEHEPLTTCWPRRELYLMAVTFPDKQKWVASFEAAIKSLQRVDATFKRTRLQEFRILELKGDRRLELNCTLIVSNHMLLLGADEGLFAVNIHKGQHTLVTKLTGLKSIHHMVYASGLGWVICITGQDRHVVYIHREAIKARLSQATTDETEHVPSDKIPSLVGCTVLEVARVYESLYLVTGFDDRITVLKYNTELKEFCIRKELKIQEPCSCICLADDFAIVGTEKFYKFSLEHPSLTEFVDKKDNSLAFAAFGAAIHNSFPLAVVNVTPEGLPMEFLLCFHEYGFFVDCHGKRSRPKDMKWSCLPLAFAYSEPYLFVVYFNSIQAITIPANKMHTRGKQTSLDIYCPRLLGNSMKTGGVYVSTNTGNSTQMMCLQGNDGISDKENKASKSERQKKFVSPKRGIMKNSQRQDSLTSISSNSSTGSTFSMYSACSGNSEL
ncbi:citron Rho-interacting kinase-like isoform X2 [Ostrea edulis]|uniref:citron Rho-interacting kinase-like isoform X2 n=1 Tax=Ostrea edulis TaxID=37623 RepID=UPI0024AFCDC2|nr:citron Rho-interacting kinase-like isoform X2 [Ostrea edulis]